MSIHMNKLAYGSQQDSQMKPQEEFDTGFKQEEPVFQNDKSKKKKGKKIKAVEPAPVQEKKQKKKGFCFSGKKKDSKKKDSKKKGGKKALPEEVENVKEAVKEKLSLEERMRNMADMRKIRTMLEDREQEDVDSTDETASYEVETDLQADMKEVLDNLSEEEADAVEQYTGGAFSSMNMHLRGEEKGDEKTLERIQHVSNVINRTKLSKDTVVVRYITLNKLHVLTGNKTAYPSAKEAHTVLSQDSYINKAIIEDKGFLSTSILPQGADDFNTLGVEMRILVPKGEKGLYVGKSKLGKVGERELILAPGTKFVILGSNTKHNDDLDNDKVILYLRAIPRETAPEGTQAG